MKILIVDDGYLPRIHRKVLERQFLGHTVEFSDPAAANTWEVDPHVAARLRPFAEAFRGSIKNTLVLDGYLMPTELAPLIAQIEASPNTPLANRFESLSDLRAIWVPAAGLGPMALSHVEGKSTYEAIAYPALAEAATWKELDLSTFADFRRLTLRPWLHAYVGLGPEAGWLELARQVPNGAALANEDLKGLLTRPSLALDLENPALTASSRQFMDTMFVPQMVALTPREAEIVTSRKLLLRMNRNRMRIRRYLRYVAAGPVEKAYLDFLSTGTKVIRVVLGSRSRSFFRFYDRSLKPVVRYVRNRSLLPWKAYNVRVKPRVLILLKRA